jgi:queuosine precursor transporter
MSNELIFLLQTLVSLAAVLVCCRLGYTYLIGLVGAQIVLMNIFVVKQMDLFGLAVTGGNVLYASIFLATDMISEHYGQRKAVRAVWFGFGASVFFLAMTRFMVAYLPNDYDLAHPAMAGLFALTPRVVIGSMVAYLISQHLDVRLFEIFGRMSKGGNLWLRNNLSTATSQLVDSLLFTFVAFYGVFGNLAEIIFTTYLFKLMVALLDTPFIYLSTVRFFRPRDSVSKRW